MKIVICGSMTASKKMVEIEKRLNELGHVVVLPEFTHDYANLDSLDEIRSESSKNKIGNDLIREHFGKIKDGEAILVVNEEKKGIQSYIGGSAFLEIGFAHILNKPIYLLNEVPEVSYKDEILAMQPKLLNGDLNLI